MAGTWRQELKQKSWRIIAYWLSLLTLSTAQVCLHRDGPAYLAVKKMSHTHAYRPTSRGQSLSWDSFFPSVSLESRQNYPAQTTVGISPLRGRRTLPNLPKEPVPYTRAGFSSRSARAYFAAATIFIDLVIFWMFLMDFSLLVTKILKCHVRQRRYHYIIIRST